jgi:hypothetical protein
MHVGSDPSLTPVKKSRGGHGQSEPGGSPEPAISEHVKPTSYAIPPRPHPNPFGCKVVSAG